MSINSVAIWQRAGTLLIMVGFENPQTRPTEHFLGKEKAGCETIGVSCYHADRLIAVEEILEDLVAYKARGGGNDVMRFAPLVDR
jgi:hypothetical protein